MGAAQFSYGQLQPLAALPHAELTFVIVGVNKLNGEGFLSPHSNPLEALRHLFRNDPSPKKWWKFLPKAATTRNCYNSNKLAGSGLGPEKGRENLGLESRRLSEGGGVLSKAFA